MADGVIEPPPRPSFDDGPSPATTSLVPARVDDGAIPGWIPPSGDAPVSGPADGLRRLTLFATAAALALAAAAARCAVLLGDHVASDVVGTSLTRPLELVSVAALGTLVALALLLVRRGRPWLGAVRADLQRGWDHGLVGDAVRGPDGSVSTYRPARDARDLLFAVAGPVGRPAPWDRRVASSRRTAVVTATFAAVAGITIVLGALVVAIGSQLTTVRVAWVIVAVAAAVLTIAAVLGWWLIADVDRRRRIVTDALDDPTRVTSLDGDRRWPALAIVGLAMLAVLAPAVGPANDVDEQVCSSAVLECRWVTVKADHGSSDARGATRRIEYGLQRATGTRLGTMVMVTGGPGISGVATWETDYATLDPRLSRAYDLVTFDPRGVGGSDGTDCPAASTGESGRLRPDSDPTVITDFVDACLAEAGVPRDALGQFAGDQVAGDIEAIREDLDAERIVVYGESYGTATAQRYAIAHPDRVQALILDGSLDITLDSDAMWLEAAHGFDDILARVFRWCAVDAACADELPDPGGAWDRLIASLEREPRSVSFAGPDGRMGTWRLTASSAIDALSAAMYTENDRMLALRALAAATHDDLVPLGRLVQPGDPYLSPVIVASDFAYLAAFCADRVDTDARRDPAAQLAWVRETSAGLGRMADVLLSGARCSGWPLATGPQPPASLPADFHAPVVILTSTGDPITPPAIGDRLARRYAAGTDVYRIMTQDGPHVTFGRGDSCQDDPVVRLLVDGTAPRPVTVCDGVLVTPFAAVPRSSLDLYGLQLRADAIDDEIYHHPDYAHWDGRGQVRLGCRYGGNVTVEDDDEGHRLTIDHCEVLQAEPMSGSGLYGVDGTVTFDITFPRGTFHYAIDADGRGSWSGVLDGSSRYGSD